MSGQAAELRQQVQRSEKELREALRMVERKQYEVCVWVCGCGCGCACVGVCGCACMHASMCVCVCVFLATPKP